MQPLGISRQYKMDANTQWLVVAGPHTHRPPSGQRPQRPASAPTHQRRFDPTEYVRQKQQRELVLAARLGRRPVTPGASRRGSSVPSSATSDVSGRGASLLFQEIGMCCMVI